MIKKKVNCLQNENVNGVIIEKHIKEMDAQVNDYENSTSINCKTRQIGRDNHYLYYADKGLPRFTRS